MKTEPVLWLKNIKHNLWLSDVQSLTGKRWIQMREKKMQKKGDKKFTPLTKIGR